MSDDHIFLEKKTPSVDPVCNVRLTLGHIKNIHVYQPMKSFTIYRCIHSTRGGSRIGNEN